MAKVRKPQVTYAFYEVYINGRCYARFDGAQYANEFVQYHKHSRKNVTELKYEVKPVQRRSL